MLRLADIQTDLIGKIAKLHSQAEELEREYVSMYNVGSVNTIRKLLYFQNFHYSKMKFLFIDEKPVRKFNETWFCLKEIGKDVNGDYHWFTLNQLIMCEM